MDHPVTLTKEQRQVLQLVYDDFFPQAAWPTFGTLDLRLARSKGFPDLEQVVRELPAGLLLPLWSGGMGPRAGRRDEAHRARFSVLRSSRKRCRAVLAGIEMVRHTGAEV